MTGRSERCPDDPTVILFRVRTRNMPRETEPSLLDKVGRWDMTVNCATTAEPIKMRLVVWTPVGTRHRVLVGARIPQWNGPCGLS